MAEMDTYHTQKAEDFQELAKEHLDGEIALYEQVRCWCPSTRSCATIWHIITCWLRKLSPARPVAPLYYHLHRSSSLL